MRYRLSDGHSNQPLLLYVGRLGPEKKLNRLKLVLDSNPGCRLAFVGHGPAEDQLKREFEGYPVYFAGKLVGETFYFFPCRLIFNICKSTGDDLSKAFASVDVFTMPSDTETLGFVVMESLASGVPAVGVAAGGLPDIIDSGLTGFLADNNEDMKDFSEKVRILTTDKKLRQQMSMASVDWAKNWNWESATSVLRNQQYRRAINNFEEKLKQYTCNP
jgi:sulfoquinovosyltransferase